MLSGSGFTDITVFTVGASHCWFQPLYGISWQPEPEPLIISQQSLKLRKWFQFMSMLRRLNNKLQKNLQFTSKKIPVWWRRNCHANAARRHTLLYLAYCDYEILMFPQQNLAWLKFSFGKVFYYGNEKSSRRRNANLNSSSSNHCTQSSVKNYCWV